MNKENIIDYVAQTPHNSNKKVLDDMLDTLIDDNILQSDWNQNDDTAKDYIKNRPFYEESSLQYFDLTNNLTFKTDTSGGITTQHGSGILDLPFVFTIGETYKFIINGVEYETICRDMTGPLGEGTLGFGDIDAAIEGDMAAVNFFAFGQYYQGGGPRSTITPDTFGMNLIIKTDSEITEFAIGGMVLNIVKIDKKYLSDLIGMSSTGVHSEIFNNYKNNIASGEYSHAEGNSTTSSGEYSHAEGKETTASGSTSHAEGQSAVASGHYSHAEGYNTTASGSTSHAEGNFTTASGKYSHAEGYYTKASSSYQHVQGKYNIEDTTNTYAHIVGNGASITARSNAHTLDWSGNAWYAGSVEGTAIILKSPNGTRFNITVGDDGVLSATEIIE